MKRIAFFFSLFCLVAQPLMAQNDAAMLAENCVYLGKKSYLQPGSYTASTLGIRNNGLSSFHLPDGMALQVFEADNFKGREQTFYASVVCLPSSWNNKVSSLKVYWVRDGDGNIGDGSGNNLPAQGNKVIFYKDMSYSGIAKELNTGNFGADVLGFLTDNVSSIYIPKGKSVQVSDKSGRSQTFTNSITNLTMAGWDNRINSGIIKDDFIDGGAGTLPPQGDKVIFYGDAKYSGMAKDFPLGSFNSGSLGFLSGNISSIYIPSGQVVKVYDSRNNNRTFTTSVTDLAQFGWNDKITTGNITGSGGSGNLPPQGNKVIFYRDMKYSGMAKEVDLGVFISSSLGFLLEQVSSVYIPSGWTLQVRDRSGRTQHFTSSISNLSQYGWDNKIYSGTISNNSGGEQGDNSGGQGGNWGVVNLYADANYKGSVTPCKEGKINSLGFGANISSIQLPTGFAITVYQGQNLTGASKTFTSSVSNMASFFGWDNKINSVYVYRL